MKKAVFDAYCPSMNKIKHGSGLIELERRMCNCGAYYPTLVALKAHIPHCLGDQEDFDSDSEDCDDLDYNFESDTDDAVQE